MKATMNTYNLVDKKEPETILYHAIAESELQVKELAEINGIDITDMTIELERTNVKPEFCKAYSARLTSAIVQ